MLLEKVLCQLKDQIRTKTENPFDFFLIACVPIVEKYCFQHIESVQVYDVKGKGSVSETRKKIVSAQGEARA